MDGCDVMVWIGPGSFLPGVAGVGGAGVRGAQTRTKEVWLMVVTCSELEHSTDMSGERSEISYRQTVSTAFKSTFDGRG